jgi:Circularly permutated YpsA SLOG family
MLTKVITGGQTGADQAAWRAARAAGLETGEWMPAGFLTEDGSRPEFADLYGAAETSSASYPPRARMNVQAGDGTLWLGNVGSLGARATLAACRKAGKPWLEVVPGSTDPSTVAAWVVDQGIRVLNVAGNRESSSSGIGEQAERFMIGVVSLIISWVRHDPTKVHASYARLDEQEQGEDESESWVEVRLGGIDSMASGGREWFRSELQVDDQVTLQVLEPGEYDLGELCDPPTRK